MKKQTTANLRRLMLPLCAVAACCLQPLAAQAGTITGFGAIVGPGLGTVAIPVISTPSEGNDDQPGQVGFDANIVVPIKRFDGPGYIDIEFFVRDSLPPGAAPKTTEYLFFESVDNNSGVNWSSYVMQLGSGLGAGFLQSPGGDGLDFDAPLYTAAPTSTAFPIVALGEDILAFGGGLHSTGAEIYQFRVDVPDGIQTFTLRQYPIPVPEPGTLVLASVALVGLAIAFRRHRG